MCREICLAYRKAASQSVAETDAGPQLKCEEGEEGGLFDELDLEQTVAALLRLFTFCGVPSPWEAVNMLKCAAPT